MDLLHLLGCLALMLFGMALMQFNSVLSRKAGIGLIWLTSGLATYFLSGSIPLACAVLMAWIFLPLWEMVFVLRQLRVPRHRELTDGQPPREASADLSDLTGELLDLGFEKLDDCRLDPAEHNQYYRIFIRQDGLVQATIGFVSHGPIGFHFVAFTSHGKDERRWVTWDYPLTYGLVMPPNVAVYRCLDCEDVQSLYQAHLDFLEINDVRDDDLAAGEKTPEAARARLEETLNQQIEYNISQGFLAPATKNDNETFCYSWRGTFYVARQVLRDLL